MAFPNGVASGDTTQTKTTLWARSSVSGDVTFEVSDPSGATVATQTVTVANPDQPVAVDLGGLTSDTAYTYRVTGPDNATTTGTFVTAAPLGAHTGLRFGVSGDWRGELAPFVAVENAD